MSFPDAKNPSERRMYRSKISASLIIHQVRIMANYHNPWGIRKSHDIRAETQDIKIILPEVSEAIRAVWFSIRTPHHCPFSICIVGIVRIVILSPTIATKALTGSDLITIEKFIFKFLNHCDHNEHPFLHTKVTKKFNFQHLKSGVHFSYNGSRKWK